MDSWAQAINPAKVKFNYRLANKEGWEANTPAQKFRRLDPKIGELVLKLEDPRYNLTIADCVETKHILTLSGEHDAGSVNGTKGLYNLNVVGSIDTNISARFNEQMTLRHGVSGDLRNIQTNNR